MSRTTTAVQRKRGSCREARSGRNPTGCRQPARDCYGISRPATLPESRHRAAPTARETTRTGKVIAIRTGRRTGCTRSLAPGRPGERVTPLDSAAASRRPQRFAAPFDSRPARIPRERRGARPVLRGFWIVRRVGSTGLADLPCPGPHDAIAGSAEQPDWLGLWPNIGRFGTRAAC